MAKKLARKSARKSAKKSAKKSARKSARKSAKKAAKAAPKRAAKKSSRASAAARKPRTGIVAATHTIGVLHLGARAQFKDLVEVMRAAAERKVQTQRPGETVGIELDGTVPGHYANGDLNTLDNDADTLVANTSVKVIVAAGGPQSAVAAMEATAEVDGARGDTPIVFTTVTDPVGIGLVEDLNTPGGNLTGMAGQTSEMDPRRLKLLHAYVSQPAKTKIGALVNPSRQGQPKQYQALRREARRLGLRLVAKRGRNDNKIRNAFQAFSGPNFLGAVVTADAFFNNKRALIIQEARNNRVPTIYQWRGFAEEGGLISYGPSIKEAYEKAGEYVGRIILGENPATMACSTPSGFELVLNTTTAAALGLSAPNNIDGVPVVKIP